MSSSMATTTITASFGGGGRCSLCLIQLPLPPTTEQAYLLPTFLRQLVALVGFDVTLPLCDRCHGDVTSAIDILRQLDKLQKTLRRGVEGIRDKKKVKKELVAPILNGMEDKVALTPEATISFNPPLKNEHVNAESIVPTPRVEISLQTVVPSSSSPTVSSQPVLTLSTEGYYLGPVPFTPTTPPIPHQTSNYQEQPVQNCYQQDIENGDQDPDPEYFPDNSPQNDDDDDDEISDHAEEKQPWPVMSPQNRHSGSDILPPPPSRAGPNQRALKPTRKRPGPWDPEKKALILAKRKAAQVEVLGPIETAPDGRLYFEGVEIIKVGNSYSCSACDWSDAKMSTLEPEKCANWAKVRAIKLHVRGIHLRAYRCDPCGKHFTCPRSLRSHLASKLHAENVPTTCPICAITLPKVKLDSHLFSHKSPAEQEAELAAKPEKPRRPKKKPSKERVRIPRKKPVDPSTPRPAQSRKGIKRTRPFARHPKVPCEICGRPSSAVYMPNHVWSHKSEAEKEAARKFGLAPKIVTQPKPIAPHPKVECPICSKFVWRFYLDRHIETHQAPEERRTFACTWPGCDKKFKQKAFMRGHVKFVHQTEKVDHHVCTAPGCSKRYTSLKTLHQHVATWHNRALNSHHCPICNNSFYKKYMFEKHMKNHPPASDHTHFCPHCPRKFVNSSLLQGHRTHEHGEKFPDKKITRVRPKKKRTKARNIREQLSCSESEEEESDEENYDVKNIRKTTPVLHFAASQPSSWRGRTLRSFQTKSSAM